MRIMEKETLHMQRDRKLLKMISVGVLIVVIVAFILLFIAERPMRQDRAQSFNAARRTEGIQNANQFYKSDLNRVYYTVGGRNKKGRNVFVIMNHRHKAVRIVPVDSGISHLAIVHRVKFQDHARKILNISPSIFNGKTVWIASYENRTKQLCYHTFKFDSGKSLQSITNV